jgi:predicted pyridoxine 5'-phosphate oxidase superfamily flavin-nucleotide-binding protein
MDRVKLASSGAHDSSFSQADAEGFSLTWNRHDLNSDLKEMASRSVLCWLATVDAHGRPNLSPKEVFVVADETHIVIANIASPQSAKNIRANSHVCLSFVDVFVQKGFKVTGSATEVQPQQPGYPQWQSLLQPLVGESFRFSSVFVVQIETMTPIVAPSYQLRPADTTEASQVQAALRTYGVERLAHPKVRWPKA